MNHERTTGPFNLGDTAPVRTNWRTLCIVGAFLASVFGSWIMIRADVADQGKRLSTVEARSATDHDILLEIRADLKALSREQRDRR